MFLGLLDPDLDPLVRGMNPDLNPILYHQAKIVRKTLIPTGVLLCDFFLTLSLKMM
jgi:hypothetical protein